MKSKFLVGFLATSLCSFALFPTNIEHENPPVMTVEACEEAKFTVEDHFNTYITELYEDCSLDKHGLNKKVFRLGMVGYLNLIKSNKLANPNVLSIVDYDLPSTMERLFVIDLKKRGLLKKVLVAHGKNSGWNYASKFSNIPQSLQSSLGFYATAETYAGKYGYSLRLDGKDPSFNCKARDRAIVMHGADYVSRKFIVQEGRLGRSWGCLSLTTGDTKEIIQTIKEGSCIYVHRSQKSYLEKSKILDEDKAIEMWAVRDGYSTSSL